MKVFQLIPGLYFGDAIGNDALALKKLIQERKIETEIFAKVIDERLPENSASYIARFPKVDKEDIVIYHGAIGTEINQMLAQLSCKKVMVYHNVTPASFFAPYAVENTKISELGYQGMKYLADKLDYCIADSEYNRQNLLEMGYKCPIDVCPIVIPFEDYDKEPNPDILNKYREDGITNILFVGRIVSNKKQEDIIKAFYAYRTRYNQCSRLFLVGSDSLPKYTERLKRYVRKLSLEEHVVLTGHIGFSEILAYYHLSDLFLCMSEHEGFCVPLLEAMHFGIPIVAYNSTAVPETLGKGGLLLKEKAPWFTAAIMQRVLTDQDMKAAIKKEQAKILYQYSYPVVSKRFNELLDRILEGKESK